MSEISTTARRPWIAVVFSLLSTGLGHIYCGHITTGVILFLTSLLFAPIAVAAALMSPSAPVLVALLAAFAGVLGLYLYAVIDAFRVARRTGEHFELREYNRTLVYFLFIVIGVTYPAGIVSYLRAAVFEAFLIPDVRNMIPNLLPGDRILVNKLAFHGEVAKRGDLLVFHNPVNRQQNWVKRVIALPGDTVAVRGGDVLVNGKKLERDRVPSASLAAIADHIDGDVYYETNAGSRYMIMLTPVPKPVADYEEKRVPEGACFVLGDNRNRSEDSRSFGFVPLGEIFGTVQYIYWPAETWDRFGAYRN